MRRSLLRAAGATRQPPRAGQDGPRACSTVHGMLTGQMCGGTVATMVHDEVELSLARLSAGGERVAVAA